MQSRRASPDRWWEVLPKEWENRMFRLHQRLWGRCAKREQVQTSVGECFSEVGDTGLEPVTSSVSCWRASQLRQSPEFVLIIVRTVGLTSNRFRPSARSDSIHRGDVVLPRISDIYERCGTTGQAHEQDLENSNTRRGLRRAVGGFESQNQGAGAARGGAAGANRG